MKSFAGAKIIEQYSVLDYKIDIYIYIYLPDHQLAIEIDEKGHLRQI